jgi:transposase-like protein
MRTRRFRGKQHYVWRAVDQDGNVLDIPIQSRRSATAAKRVSLLLVATAATYFGGQRTREVPDQ